MCSKCAQKIQFVSKNAKKPCKINGFPMGTFYDNIVNQHCADFLCN